MRVGVVGDLHAPFVHPMYLRFILDTFRKWRVNHVHFAGDIADQHALSQWEHNPNGMSSEDESSAAEREIGKWHKAFPGATVSIGNHDERHYRLARKNGMPDRYLRSYAEVWGTGKWKWDYEFRIDDVTHLHGTGASGKDAAINLAIQRRCSISMGHVHAYAGVKWHSNTDDTVFGLNSGCGIDIPAYAFDYGKSFPIRPVLGCGIVLDGEQAMFVKMPCGKGERYHRSRAGKKRKFLKFLRR